MILFPVRKHIVLIMAIALIGFAFFAPEKEGKIPSVTKEHLGASKAQTISLIPPKIKVKLKKM